MQNATGRRVWTIAQIVLSVIVLVVTVIGLIATWAGYWIGSNAVIALSVATEKTAQGLEKGVNRLDAAIADLSTQVQTTEQKLQTLSQNVADEGLAAQVLSNAQKQRLQTASDRVNDTLTSVHNAYSSASALYQSLNRIPGVNLPELGDALLQDAELDVSDAGADLQDLTSAISDVHERNAERIAALSELAGRIHTRLENLRARLDPIQAVLTRVQEVSVQIRTVVPPIFFGMSVFLSLVELWVVVTQVIIIRMAWRQLRPAAPPPAADRPPSAPALPPLAGETSPSVTTPPAADAAP